MSDRLQKLIDENAKLLAERERLLRELQELRDKVDGDIPFIIGRPWGAADSPDTTGNPEAMTGPGKPAKTRSTGDVEERYHD